MSHKVHPLAHRLGVVTDWKSRWFDLKNYNQTLKEDVLLRDYLREKLRKMSVKDIEIERSGNVVKIIVKTGRPGLLIGRGGSGIEQLQKNIEAFLGKMRKINVADQPKPAKGQKGQKKEAKPAIKVEVEEIKNPDSQALLVGFNIADQIEKRIPFRRVMKEAIAKSMQSREVQGIKVKISGRLDGAEIARTEWLAKGKIPLQTLRADVDYGFTEAICTYGKIGIKVWIYRGEVFKK